ncbi:MAG: hypothetical protein A3E78_01340 [Alphaproteobacteria bacterium RIFCSPHIGHO2_12_FULL_63_12]|nr:MAG: hypothetical protein A3E78_01340 [Alphaproteobacteria bacterium RIFCSPHIGHO2_12_FULL_63_12]
MTQMTTLEVRKDDLFRTRISERAAPPLKDGEILVKVDRFALTANNITYGVVGEKIGYWKFFPAEEGWGVIPVWGFADVVQSKHPEVKVGERLYGYFPMGTHLVMAPDKVKGERLQDGAAHRAGLPPVYNSYARTRAEAHFDPAMENERMLLFPLYATSFCLYDFLVDNQWFGARQIIIASASSKTAIGLAMAIADDKSAPDLVGLTSAGNLGTVSKLKLYSSVHAYNDIASIDDKAPTVIVDMSGDGKILSALHAHLGENMRYCANVGVTHYEDTQMGPDFIRERSAMFFAPGHIQKRTADWGTGVFEKKAFVFWRDAAVKSRAWLKFEKALGMKGLEAAYNRVLKGEAAPDRGVIVEL